MPKSLKMNRVGIVYYKKYIVKNTISLLIKYTVIGWCTLFSMTNLWAQQTDIALCTYSPVANPINISGITQNLSGVTYNEETNTLFMVGNGPLAVYETTLNGTLLRTIPLSSSDFDDTEGIVHIGGTRFAVSDEEYKQIILFDIPSTGTIITSIEYVQLPLSFGPWGRNSNKSLEGVSYDPATNKIYAVKEGGDDNGTQIPKGFYSFELPTSLPQTLAVSDVEQLCNITTDPFGLSDLAGMHHLGATFPGNTGILLLSENDTGLVHINENCKELGRLSLADMNQPEGVTMGSNRVIYAVGEPNQLQIFTPDPLPVITNYQLIDCGNNNLNVQLTLGNLNPAATYDVYYTTDLTNPNGWQPATPNGLQISGSTLIWDDCEVPERDAAFYRIEGTCDSDNDGLTDAFEILSVGTNPYEADSDADGIPDSAEDSDCDGFTNIDEYTNPFMGVTSNCGNCRQRDSLALIDIFSSFTNAAYMWDANQPITTWRGVTLNEDGCVERFAIYEANLKGTLSPSIGNLSELEILNFSEENSLSGPLPTTIGNLTKLTHLYLAYNRFSGNIPSSIGDLDSLDVLDLRGNQLTGEIPASIGDLTTLRHLLLSRNDLVGNIPASVGNLTNLETLDLEWNQLISIPSSIGNLDNLKRLSLQFNQLTGLPSEIGDLNSLTTLWLGNNQLTEIPASIGGLSKLEHLSLRNNLLTNLPPTVGNLSNLTRLELRGNQLTEIPTSIGNLSNLVRLDIGDNALSNLPVSMGNLHNLEVLSFDNNQITGSMPVWLADLEKLSVLSTINNQLAGCYADELSVLCSRIAYYSNKNTRISDGNNFDADWEDFCNSGAGVCPADIPCYERDRAILIDFYNSTNGSNWTIKWNLSAPMNTWHGVTLNAEGCVESIIIGTNKIGGTLPASIGDLSELKILALGGNEIGGTIPTEIGQLTKLTNLGLGGNNLTGGIPTQIGDLLNLEQLWLADNHNLGGSIPSELGQLTKLTHLILNNSNITGSLPPELVGMAKIRYWKLYNNDLSGCYPPELAVLCSRLHPDFSKNDKVNVGNNFSANWEDFCSSQSGVCQGGAKVNESYISGYNIYPNPTQNGTTLHLEFNSQTDSENATLSIYNITGQLIQSEDLLIQNGQNHFMTTLEQYATGVYFVKLQSGTYTATQKLIIQ